MMREISPAAALALHHSALVVDTHQDLPYRLWLCWADIGQRTEEGHLDFPRMRQGNLGAAFMSIFVPGEYASGGAARFALEMMDIAARIVEASPAEVEFASCAAEIGLIRSRGKIAFLRGIEGGHAIEDSLGALRSFYRAGARYLTLTHVNTNNWADSSGNYYSPRYDPATLEVHGGLSPFGREVVREMNRLGMMVDISHASDKCFWAALEESRAPIFASHSSARALCNVPRNLTDDMLRALAAKEGMCMVNFGAVFLDDAVADGARRRYADLAPQIAEIERAHGSDLRGAELAAERLFAAYPIARTNLGRLADHVEHIAKVAGWKCVGLGSDFDGVRDLPDGMTDVTMLPGLTRELLARGLDEHQVRGILGENFLDYMMRVENAAGT